MGARGAAPRCDESEAATTLGTRDATLLDAAGAACPSPGDALGLLDLEQAGREGEAHSLPGPRQPGWHGQPRHRGPERVERRARGRPGRGRAVRTPPAEVGRRRLRPHHPQVCGGFRTRADSRAEHDVYAPVSYTHLTL